MRDQGHRRPELYAQSVVDLGFELQQDALLAIERLKG